MIPSNPSIPMRIKVTACVLLCAALAWIVASQYRLERAINDLRAEREQAAGTAIEAEQARQQQIERIQTTLEEVKTQNTFAQPVSAPPPADGGSTSNSRVNGFQPQTFSFAPATANRGPSPGVVEYDPTDPNQPPPSAAEPVLNTLPKRGWGDEQAAGPPDTFQAGDIPSAWASRDPDGGAEWLGLEYAEPVNVAEVRIRETFNPGAISKVTALVNGQEVTLWEGTAAGGQAPRDFLVKPNQPVWAKDIVVHLDTTRVPGWNEIDAVELISTDGKRQWATGTTASSTYAPPRMAQSPPP